MAISWAAIIPALARVAEVVLKAIGIVWVYQAGKNKVRLETATNEAEKRRGQQEKLAAAGDLSDPGNLADQLRGKR